MDSGAQTRVGRFFDRHPRLLRALAPLAIGDRPALLLQLADATGAVQWRYVVCSHERLRGQRPLGMRTRAKFHGSLSTK